MPPKGFKYSTYKRINKKCIICNIVFSVKPSDSQKGVGKFCSRKCMGKYISIYSKKENNPNWKGGRNWNYIRMEILIRDDYTCQICGLREREIMEIDHIKLKKQFPELLFQGENLITLCPNCHRRKTIRDKKARISIKDVPIWKK